MLEAVEPKNENVITIKLEESPRTATNWAIIFACVALGLLVAVSQVAQLVRLFSTQG